MMTNRREFLKQSLLTGAGLAAMPNLLYATTSNVAPSDKVKIGLIGCNGIGNSNIRSYLKNKECECVAIADVDPSILEKRKGEIEQLQDKKVTIYKDWRRLIDNKDVDLVIVATPDHWHCHIMIAACQAGKHVYVEKPIGTTITECDLMLRAAQRYNKVIIQVGQSQRSTPHWKDAVDYVHTGQLGKIRIVRVFCYLGWVSSVPVKPDSKAPEGVDYDMWLGPAPLRPFNANRFHFNFRWFWDYAGGLMTDWGVHLLDHALVGMKQAAPKSIMAMGGKLGYPTDACETPDTLHTIYDFGDFTILWEHGIGIGDGGYGREHGVAFIGENGLLIVDRSGWEVIPEKTNKAAVPIEKVHYKLDPSMPSGLDLHTRNHLDCIKSGNRNTNASIEIGAHICKFSALGNIAYRTGKKLFWDGSRITNDEAANAYLTKEYRSPWALPTL